MCRTTRHRVSQGMCWTESVVAGRRGHSLCNISGSMSRPLTKCAQAGWRRRRRNARRMLAKMLFATLASGQTPTLRQNCPKAASEPKFGPSQGQRSDRCWRHVAESGIVVAEVSQHRLSIWRPPEGHLIQRRWRKLLRLVQRLMRRRACMCLTKLRKPRCHLRLQKEETTTAACDIERALA